MEAEKGLAGDRERQIKDEKADQRNSWRDSENQKNGENNSTAAKEMEQRVAGIEPAKGREEPVSMRAELIVSGGQNLFDRPDAIRADETVHLHPERDERDQINKTERSKKPSLRPEVCRWPDIVAPEESRYRRTESPMARNDSVEEF